MSKKRKKNSSNPQWSNTITLPALGLEPNEAREVIDRINADDAEDIEHIEAAIETEKQKIIKYLRETIPLLAYMPDHKFEAKTMLDYTASNRLWFLFGNNKVAALSTLDSLKDHYKRLKAGEINIYREYMRPMGWSVGASTAAEHHLPPLTAEQIETLYQLQGNNNNVYRLLDIMTSLYPELAL